MSMPVINWFQHVCVQVKHDSAKHDSVLPGRHEGDEKEEELVEEAGVGASSAALLFLCLATSG